MIRINYQSDFKIIEKSLNGDINTPFRFTYRTVLSGCVVAEFDGHGYKNCRRLDDGGLLVIFGRHGLRPGALSVKREYYLSDADFADGICNLVSVGIQVLSSLPERRMRARRRSCPIRIMPHTMRCRASLCQRGSMMMY